MIRHPRLFHWWCSKGGLITSLVLVAFNTVSFFFWTHWWASFVAALASATMVPLWVKTHLNWKQAFGHDGLIDDSFAEMRRRRSQAGTN